MKRYGLVGSVKTLKSKSNAATQPSMRVARKAPVRGAAISAFAECSDSDGSDHEKEDPMNRAAVNRRLAAEQDKRAKQLEQTQIAAVLEDPTVYDYDGTTDEVRDHKKTMLKTQAEQVKKAPRYIVNLLEQSKMRSIEQDRAYDRKLAKEREEGDKEYGQADMKFVTTAYKRKLMEQKKWEYAQEMEETKEKLAEEKMKTGGGMTSFYSNLLTKNIAMGSDVHNATSAFTMGSTMHSTAAKYITGSDIKEEKHCASDINEPYVEKESADVEGEDSKLQIKKSCTVSGGFVDDENVKHSKRHRIDEIGDADQENIRKKQLNDRDAVIAAAKARALARKRKNE